MGEASADAISKAMEVKDAMDSILASLQCMLKIRRAISLQTKMASGFDERQLNECDIEHTSSSIHFDVLGLATIGLHFDEISFPSINPRKAMAEVAGAAYLAFEAVETTAQAGFAAYMVAQPTAPLKATFSQVASAPDDATAASLARSNHSLTIVGHKAYIFGGEVGEDKVASNDVHVINLLPEEIATEKAESAYALLPALEIGSTGGEKPGDRAGGVPVGRTRHAACGLNICVAVFGGVDTDGRVIDEGGNIWLFNTAHSAWEVLKPRDASREVPEARADGKLFEHRNCPILYGGHGKIDSAALKDVWHFSYADRIWTRLPDSPEPSLNASFADGTLHLLTYATGTSSLSGALHSLQIPPSIDPALPPSWTGATFPSNPLTPAPAPRIQAGLLPITTGHGRFYLLNMFGSRLSSSAKSTSSEPAALDPTTTDAPTQFPDLWTLQLPSGPAPVSSGSVTTASKVLDALRPAAIKDAIRGAVKADTGTHGWAEVIVLPPDLTAMPSGTSGKVHPGPRAGFGCDVLKKGEGAGKTVVLWGGLNAKGEREGDGWLVKLE
ncbi:hypothetical protein LTR95_001777 [Oleoguttula sp. CCFEE 5521]